MTGAVFAIGLTSFSRADGIGVRRSLARLAKRALLIEAGQIVRDGPAQEVLGA